ncbi:hypothetical protein CVT25_006762 [Psilocybe cyanescens]|uniref:AB hydrolase-1 domain-containing protein n=1 Tax=Psilocybe cyanescens TaxID=93625 RepID=A0A409X7I7_PSICY|nr:hypothetical protein CVT25_006762 [Psilocybe cyanescens]
MSSKESPKITEGEIHFDVPSAGKPCKTWYKIFGDLSSGKRPLVALHGGPGVNSDYLEILSDITVSHSIPVVIYDQIGNGLSTHLQEKMGDARFWTVQLFIDELNNLLNNLGIADDFDLLGHSWGGIFAASFAITKPHGLKHLILASAPADMPLTIKSQEALRSQLSQDVQDVLNRHEAEGTTDSEEYRDACNVFNFRYVCRLDPMPQPILNGFGWIEKDPTVYMTMYYDEMTDVVVSPYFKAIPKVKWVKFSSALVMSTNESLKVTTGEIPFDVAAAGKPCKTWYKVFGDLNSGKRPLIALHGGPGVNSEYLEVLSDITITHSIPVIVYDQIGNGLSTHLQEKMGDEQFWTVQLFIDELNNLLKFFGIADNYDLLGHSWGGMLAASFAIRQPHGLKHLILASAPADMHATAESQENLRSQLPQDVQDILTKHEKDGTTDSDAYRAASDVFNFRYVCRINPMPQALLNGFGWIAKDPTVYMTMNGPSEFKIQGSLRNWSVLNEIHKINVPTLLTNGHYDEVTDVLVAPYFKAIPKVKWVVFAVSWVQSFRHFFSVVDILAA